MILWVDWAFLRLMQLIPPRHGWAGKFQCPLHVSGRLALILFHVASQLLYFVVTQKCPTKKEGEDQSCRAS